MASGPMYVLRWYLNPDQVKNSLFGCAQLTAGIKHHSCKHIPAEKRSVSCVSLSPNYLDVYSEVRTGMNLCPKNHRRTTGCSAGRDYRVEYRTFRTPKPPDLAQNPATSNLEYFLTRRVL